MFLKSLAVATALLTLSAPAVAVTLDAGISGTITVSALNPAPGTTFTLTGGFTSYSQTGLPAITTDLDQYSFTANGTSTGFDVPTLTTSYGSVTGSINAYGQLIQSFTSPGLTITFDDATGAAGTVRGTLNSTGPQSPAGYPGPVDFSPANGASFVGRYTRTNALTGEGTYVGSITFPAVPEPATWGMMILGFGLVGGAARRSRRTLAAA